MIEYLSSYKHIKYEDINIGKLLDKGNVSVYKGTYLDKHVAIKKYKYTEDNIDTIMTELEISHKFNSDRIMKTYGYSYNKDETLLYLVMEYINSKDLYTYLEQDKYHIYLDEIVGRDNYPYFDERYSCFFTMSRKTKLSIIISFLKAMKALWDENIIHGDLKTLNLAIQRENDDIYIKIIDFGTCQHKDNIEIDYCCSTDGYISPELNFEPCILSHKSDIYAVGVIMTEIWFSYIEHFDYKESRNNLFKQLRIMKNHDPDMEKIIRKCVVIDPDKRPDIYKLLKMVQKLPED